MIDLAPSRVPLFRSAVRLSGGRGGPLPRRRLGSGFAASIVVHLAAGLGAVVLSLLSVDAVSAPPVIVVFTPLPPAAPRLVPRREARPAPPPPPAAPAREQRVAPRAAAPAPLPPIETARPRPAPEPMRVESRPPAIRVHDAAPELRLRDDVPPAPRSPRATVAPVGADAPILSGTGPQPELVFLVPGPQRPRDAGGGIAGRGDGLPAVPGVDPGGSGRASAAGHGGGGPSGGAVLGTEGAFAGTGLAASLGRRYGVHMVAASGLGQRTSDGSRYALLLPVLTETCKRLAFRGERRGAAGDAVVSVQVDEDAIAIRYRDGTVHVIVPTGDGLVALYVSAEARGAATRSKVVEAERALGALTRVLARERRG